MPEPNPAPNPFSTPPPSEGGVDDEADLEYMQNMLRNPEMQKMMYPYLPR